MTNIIARVTAVETPSSWTVTTAWDLLTLKVSAAASATLPDLSWTPVTLMLAVPFAEVEVTVICT